MPHLVKPWLDFSKFKGVRHMPHLVERWLVFFSSFKMVGHMPHLVETSLIFFKFEEVRHMFDLVEHIYSSSYCRIKFFYKNNQIIIWLMAKHIELNVFIFISYLFLANKNIIWSYFHWNLCVCNNWVAHLTKLVFFIFVKDFLIYSVNILVGPRHISWLWPTRRFSFPNIT